MSMLEEITKKSLPLREKVCKPFIIEKGNELFILFYLVHIIKCVQNNLIN